MMKTYLSKILSTPSAVPELYTDLRSFLPKITEYFSLNLRGNDCQAQVKMLLEYLVYGQPQSDIPAVPGKHAYSIQFLPRPVKTENVKIKMVGDIKETEQAVTDHEFSSSLYVNLENPDSPIDSVLYSEKTKLTLYAIPGSEKMDDIYKFIKSQYGLGQKDHQLVVLEIGLWSKREGHAVCFVYKKTPNTEEFYFVDPTKERIESGVSEFFGNYSKEYRYFALKELYKQEGDLGSSLYKRGFIYVKPENSDNMEPPRKAQRIQEDSGDTIAIPKSKKKPKISVENDADQDCFRQRILEKVEFAKSILGELKINFYFFDLGNIYFLKTQGGETVYVSLTESYRKLNSGLYHKGAIEVHFQNKDVVKLMFDIKKIIQTSSEVNFYDGASQRYYDSSINKKGKIADLTQSSSMEIQDSNHNDASPRFLKTRSSTDLLVDMLTIKNKLVKYNVENEDERTHLQVKIDNIKPTIENWLRVVYPYFVDDFPLKIEKVYCNKISNEQDIFFYCFSNSMRVVNGALHLCNVVTQDEFLVRFKRQAFEGIIFYDSQTQSYYETDHTKKSLVKILNDSWHVQKTLERSYDYLKSQFKLASLSSAIYNKLYQHIQEIPAQIERLNQKIEITISPLVNTQYQDYRENMVYHRKDLAKTVYIKRLNGHCRTVDIEVHSTNNDKLYFSFVNNTTPFMGIIYDDHTKLHYSFYIANQKTTNRSNEKPKIFPIFTQVKVTNLQKEFSDQRTQFNANLRSLPQQAMHSQFPNSGPR